MPTNPQRSPAGRFRSGSHPARRMPLDLHTAAEPQPVDVQPAIVGRSAQPAMGGRTAPPGPRLGNPPAAVVARGNLPNPGRRKAILRPSVPAPRGSDRRPRTGLLALKAKVMLRGPAGPRVECAAEQDAWNLLELEGHHFPLSARRPSCTHRSGRRHSSRRWRSTRRRPWIC
jgi:hypothetical protein